MNTKNELEKEIRERRAEIQRNEHQCASEGRESG